MMVSGKRQTRSGSDRLTTALSSVMEFSEFLEKLRETDRKTLSRQLELFQEKVGGASVARWQRLACVLMTLAPFPPKLLPPMGLQFFVPDGRYRKQSFALQIEADGSLIVYATNVLAEGVRQGIIGKSRQVNGQSVHGIAGGDEVLTVVAYDGQTPDPAGIYKAMTGWNRKAIGIIVPVAASAALVQAVEKLCAIASLEWAAELQQP